MPNGLRISIDGKDLLFTPSGAVLDLASNLDVGRWLAHSPLEKCRNHLLYDLNGQEQKPLRANYKFNDSNQLVVTVSDDNPGVDETAVVTLPGRVVVDDDHDITYELFDDTGLPLEQSITLYGSLRFDSPFRLVIDLDHGGQAVLRSQEPDTPIEAGSALIPTPDGGDILYFKAITFNQFTTPEGTITQAADADIAFQGAWSLAQDGLKFNLTGGGDDSRQHAVIGIGGKYKAVSGGLEVEWSSDTGLTAKLLIEGNHTFDSGSASWSVGIGYSGTTVTARAAGRFQHTFKDGREFTIHGALNATTDDGASTRLALELDAAYTFRNGVIKFSAVTRFGSTRIEHDLQLTGELSFQNGKLSFAVHYGSDNVVSLRVDYEGDSKNFLKHFGLEFKRDAKGNIKFKVNFRIEFTLLNGHIVAKPLEQLAA